ncbi:MAG: PEP-CTERM sorting domain-containing protein [Phycisphaerales bacterium]|nr:PEP-CTERM sorting domain-containing protein [Phycisphaerales bacterium]
MNKTLICAALAASAGLAAADVYSDSTGDLFDNGFTHLDIASVTMTNDATWLNISVQTAGDLDASNWGKYGVGINNGQGDPSDAGNGWGRPIDWNGQVITHWTASWADDGGSGFGGEVYNFNAGWNLLGATWNGDTNVVGDDSGHAAGIQSWSVLLSDLGVGVGDTISFDVITSGGGGGDPGVDHLSRSDMATPDWSVASVAGTFSSYTIVPAPGALALLGVAGLVARRRR